ncbi:MAG: radical SAM family heme chaperone HemW [Oscillospiraceae bacterium]|nr:radical SAM family heme chaperone HemW [Oscillospiraceae bacterium]
MIGLYIHVPFCRKKCPYCDFYSVGFNPEKTPEFSAELAEKYADAVLRNIRHYNERYDTVYFGGGTPILLSRQIPRILAEIHRTASAEVTVECNPSEMDEETLKILFDCGVNRLSVGVQSVSNRDLRLLGRSHTFEQAKQAILTANKVGFCDILVDLMLGLPGQDHVSLVYTISKLRELPITHVSAYLLKIEPNTAFGKNPPPLPDEEKTADLYLSAVNMLNSARFKQYEISNFAKGGMTSRHNLKYWRREEYIGIGAAAHSFYKGRRFEVARDLREFINSDHQIELVTDDDPDELEEKIMLGLRLTEGIPEELYSRVQDGLPLIPKEYYKLENGRLALTPRGFLVSNELIATLLSHIKYLGTKL